MKTSILTIPVMAALCAWCLAASPVMAQSDDLAQAGSDISGANDTFAFGLLKEIATSEPTKNIFISPFSVSTVMQMVHEGAAGGTKSEIQRALHTGDVSPATLNAVRKALFDSLNSQSNGVPELVNGNWYIKYIPRTNFVFNLADGMWCQKNFQLKPDFATVIRDSFHAGLAPVDFSDASSADIINQWASKQTEGRIDNIVSFPFPRETTLVLANAVYFKGKWQDPFDANQTKPRDFYLPDGTAKKVPMMQRYATFSYEERDGYQAVQLPYEGGLQMTIILPNDHTSPAQFLQARNSVVWVDLMMGFDTQEGTLVLPKFKFDYDIRLNEPLQKLGIVRAFDPATADFSPMSTNSAGLFLGEVKQTSLVAVDEEGTEAAAATSALMTREAQNASPPKPFEMIVNRPFFFFISANGPWPGQVPVILFMGIVNDPVGAF